MDQKPPQTNKNGNKRSESDTKMTEAGMSKRQRAVRVIKKCEVKRNRSCGATPRRN